MNMQAATRSGRPVRRIERCLLGNGWTLVTVGYVTALLSIAIWAGWQLVVSYTGGSA
jgi:hypothetical protein